jgi:hypothetical protein
LKQYQKPVIAIAGTITMWRWIMIRYKNPSHRQKVKGDRIIMIILLTATIIAAILLNYLMSACFHVLPSLLLAGRSSVG